ncbi:MAG: MerR family transcriptional regulator [Bacillaceae bacterium]|nr:MerR family transcriptional regulator [Bacillaceae bacterium]
MLTDKHLSINQVSKITGLSRQVIRKWEKRYGIISPERQENGYRVFSEQDVQTLLTVKSLTEQGYSVKNAISILHDQKSSQVNSIPSQNYSPSLGNSKDSQGQMNHYIIRLLEAGTNGDEQQLQNTLKKALHERGLHFLLEKVIRPFLKEVGQRWKQGIWNEYQEHIASITIRDYLVLIRREYDRTDSQAPLVLGSCLPYERHEIGLQILLLHLSMEGWKTAYLGASPAPGAIEDTVQRLKPKMVLLSVSTVIPFDQEPELIHELDRFAGKHSETTFYLGGSGLKELKDKLSLTNIKIKQDLSDIQ